MVDTAHDIDAVRKARLLEGCGEVRTRIIEGTEHEVECDTLLSAISEKPDFSVFNGCEPVLDEKGDLVVDENGLASIQGIDNVYVAGDFLFGPKTVVEAVASARKAVDAIVARFSAAKI